MKTKAIRRSNKSQPLTHEQQIERDRKYQVWLVKRYVPKIRSKPATSDTIDPRYKWMADEERLTARRNGEMPYQHGMVQGYNQLTKEQKDLVGL